MVKRHPAQPAYNKLAFNGYHIEGQFNNGIDNCWDDFHDHYPTLALYTHSFQSVGPGVFSPREIYLQQLEDGFYRNIVIRDNNDVVLWDEAKELDFLARSA